MTNQIQNQLRADENSTGLFPISQYQIVNFARQLGPNEYTFNPRLGYISLNQALNNDDVLCVAYEGTVNGIAFKVGEFSMDIQRNTTIPEIMFLKMLKGPSQRPDLPMWDLMMKNVYSLGSFQVQPKDFKLNIVYADDPSGADLNYLPVKNEPNLSGVPLLNVFKLDQLNTQQERVSDGLFDLIEGVTIKLLHKSEFVGDTKGFEEHPDDVPGKYGFYVEKEVDSEIHTVTRMSIPDCYEIQGGGYLRVPDIKTSVYLRSKGDTFTCKCSKYDDEFWDILDNIPDVE
jgi:hypothetical protein